MTYDSHVTLPTDANNTELANGQEPIEVFTSNRWIGRIQSTHTYFISWNLAHLSSFKPGQEKYYEKSFGH